MANYILFADAVNAKWIGVQFQEGPEDDLIENYTIKKKLERLGNRSFKC